MVFIGEGFALDMIARMKANRALRKKSNPFMKEEDGIYAGKHLSLKFKQASPSEKKLFSKRIQEEKKRRLVLERAILVAFIILFIVAFIWFKNNFI